MLYSKTTNGFYDPEVNSNVPPDCVEIAKEHYNTLMVGQTKGKKIVADSKGYPVLQEPKEPTSEEIKSAVSLARSKAYAAESDPLFFKAQRGEATTDQWISKVLEIKTRYPDGIMPVFPTVGEGR